MTAKGKTVTLTRKQYAHLVRDVESALKRIHKMKGGGPDDYGAPQTLETYLFQHPMSMIEFYVDEGGIPMGGAGLSIKSKIKKHARKRWKTSKAKIAAAAHKHLAEVAKRAKQHLPKLLNKSKDLLKNTQEAAANKVEQLGDAALDQMQQKVKQQMYAQDLHGNVILMGGAHKRPKKRVAVQQSWTPTPLDSITKTKGGVNMREPHLAAGAC